ncbi:MAG: hypothetical protein CM15mP14_4550 [Rhodospirillaceae bacterium]|nr:MAG: hypothetical protein CM15mP14_4550 [Rhodospirillaceae bacterium]
MENRKFVLELLGLVDLTLGASVSEVLEAQVNAGGGRFKGIRYGAGFNESEAINSHNSIHLLSCIAMKSLGRICKTSRL